MKIIQLYFDGSGVECNFGTMGDLFESLIKRTSDVKDSGNYSGPWGYWTELMVCY